MSEKNPYVIVQGVFIIKVPVTNAHMPIIDKKIKIGAGTSRTQVLTALGGKVDLHAIYKLFLPPLTSKL